MGVWEYVEVAIGFLAGIGTLLVGMKMMSGGMERAADKGLRKLFSKMSDNRFAGVGVGCAVTALVQSSSATTVMVVGFVNAGVMTLFSGDVHNHGRQHRHDSHGANPCASILFRYGDFPRCLPLWESWCRCLPRATRQKTWALCWRDSA